MKEGKKFLPQQVVGDMENALNRNAIQSVKNQEYGKQLLAQIEQKGMSEESEVEVRSYLAQSAEIVNRMRAERKPFTDMLTAIRDKFTAQENAVDPKKRDTPAFLCEQHLKAYLLRKQAEAEKRLKQLDKNHQIALMRIRRRTDWTEEQKEEAIRRAEERLLQGKLLVRAGEIKKRLVPQPVAPEGFAEVFKFWWENVGKGLPAEELERALHPMLMYAKKQAAKGVLIKSERVKYVEEFMN